MQNSETHESYRVPIAVVDCTPTLSPEQFEAMTGGSEAVIIATFATGTVPERLITVVKNKVDSGTPVFLLSKNPADEHGILNERKYEAQAKFADIGTIALKNINIKDAETLLNAIRDEILQGNHGKNLADTIKKRFN